MTPPCPNVAAMIAGTLGEILSAIAVVVGGFLLVAMLKCRRYEVTVGTSRIEIGTGPFRDTLASGALESATRRPATGWRRLFAEEEIVLRSEVGRKRDFPVPTRDPDGLLTALEPKLPH